MSLSSAKAATQDNTSGTPFATAASEESSPQPLQAVVLVGNKSTWGETARVSITAADAPTGGDLTTSGFAGTSGANLVDLGNALSVAVRATCTVANSTPAMAGRLVFYDGSNAPLGYSEYLSFNADPTLRLGNGSGDFVSQRVVVDAGGARKCRFLVSSITGGTTPSWSVYVRPI